MEQTSSAALGEVPYPKTFTYPEQNRILAIARRYELGYALTDDEWHALGWLALRDRDHIEFVPVNIVAVQSEAERADNERYYRRLMLDELGRRFSFWKFRYRRKGHRITVRVKFPEGDRGRHNIDQIYLEFDKRVSEDMPALVKRVIRDATDPEFLAQRRAKREAQIDYWRNKHA